MYGWNGELGGWCANEKDSWNNLILQKPNTITYSKL